MGLFEDLKQRGVWRGYQRYVLDFEPIMLATAKRGMPVSPEGHAKVQADLRERAREAEKGMQALIPPEVQAWHPKLGYKKAPKQHNVSEGYCSTCRAEWNPLTCGPIAEGASTTHAGEPAVWARRDFLHTDTNIVETRWVKLTPWAPSHAGLIRYMRYKKHPIPVNWKTGAQTTEQTELGRLAAKTKDFLYDAVLEYRDIATLLDNHVKNWTPGPDGRVHPTFYYDTGTGQLASRRPNVMNAPRHKASQGNLFRAMIVAKPGHTLLAVDYKSFHVQTLAFAARDIDLLRLAKLDVHSYLTAHFLKLPDAGRCLGWSDGELAEYLAHVKGQHGKVRDAKVKHAMLGYNNGMGYRKLYNQYMEFFESQGEAKRLMDTLDALFPKARQFREDICMQAHEQGYLISRFGCIRWFWEVFKWAGGKWAHGDEQEAAKSFIPQNTAHCHLKEAMLRLESKLVLDAAGFIAPIHDELLFECPDDVLEEARADTADEMERPSDVLVDPVVAPAGLSVEVEVSTGKSWNEMRKQPRAS